MMDGTVTMKKQPKQARAKARVEKILSCTESLLLEHGFEAISTTSIAKAASIPVGSVYQYYESKDDILMQLYEAAYADIEKLMQSSLSNMDQSQSFKETITAMLHAFWSSAKDHKSFRPLTRWANSQRSMWESTPTADSSLGELIKQTLALSGISVPEDKEQVVMATTVTVVSVLVDLAIEEDDEETASAIMGELVTLLVKYFS